MAAVLPQHLGCIMNVRLGQHEERCVSHNDLSMDNADGLGLWHHSIC